MRLTAAGIARRAAGHRAKLDGVAAEMHARHQAGESISAIARAYGRATGSIRCIFRARGLTIRAPKIAPNPQLANGCFAPIKPKTDRQIDAIIGDAQRLVLPDAIRVEWKHWPLERRADFIRRLRAKLHSPDDRPNLPFSANVEPFDYFSPRAQAIAAALNAGLSSQLAKTRLALISQGVIWRDQLWFWSSASKYSAGPWMPGIGRPQLHRVIWADANGRPVPAGHMVRAADGNPNNLAPENLILATRNDLARENQASGLLRRSRAITASLLARSKTKKRHDKLKHIVLSGRHR